MFDKELITLNGEDTVLKKVDKKEDLEKEEISIYLNHLLRNKKYYIKNRMDSLHDISFAFTLAFSIVGFKLTLVLAIFNIVNVLGLIGALMGSIGMVLLQHAYSKFESTKYYNHKITNLRKILDYTDTQSKEPDGVEPPSEVADNFIQMNRDLMLEIGKNKYAGYENDIKELYNLSLEYIHAKKNQKEIYEPIVLSGQERFLHRFNEIEMRVKNNIKLHNNEEANLNAISTALSELNVSGIDSEIAPAGPTLSLTR